MSENVAPDSSESLLERLAVRVAQLSDESDSSARGHLACVVARLEGLAGAGLGGAESDPPVLLARRFARARAQLVTAGPCVLDPAEVWHWLEVLAQRPDPQSTPAPVRALRVRRPGYRLSRLSSP